MTIHLPRVFVTEEHLHTYRAQMGDKEGASLPSLNDFVGGIADFSKLPLQHADFTGFNLNGADFSICLATHICFDRTTLSDTCFIAARLEHCSFRQAKGDNTNWSHAVLKESIYDHAQLERNFFEGASIILSSFRGANLRYGHFSKAWVRDCTLDDATVSFTLFDPAWVLEHLRPRDMLMSLTKDRETEQRILRSFSSHF